LVTIDEIKILADGVRGSPVPVLTYSLLGRDHFQKMPEFGAENVPSLFQVIGERLGFVLGQDEDLIDSRVHAVAQGEVDESIDSAERDGGFGAVLGEGHEPFAPPPGHNKR
jgi:hypothetical protein